MKLKYLLPRSYESLLPQALLSQNIEETKATCDNCAMAPGTHRGKITYEPDLKCCTFYPFMPNYLIGASLMDSKGLANPVIEEIIATRKYALPIGLVAPPRYQMAFHQRKPSDFGNRRDWLCPYYNVESNNCRIWKNRGAVCSTFYCKSSSESAGLAFWSELSDYLTYVEMALLEEALVMLDFSPRQIVDLLAFVNRKSASSSENKSWVLPESKARKLWNGYYDDQPGFYKKTFQIVSQLNRKQFQETLGELGEERLQKVYTLAAQAF